MGIELVSRIAESWGWSEKQILKTEATAAFHYAMRAEKSRWQRLEDQRVAVEYSHYSDDGPRSKLIARISSMLCGPGVPAVWKTFVSEKVRKAMEECNRERDANFERLKRRRQRVKDKSKG